MKPVDQDRDYLHVQLWSQLKNQLGKDWTIRLDQNFWVQLEPLNNLLSDQLHLCLKKVIYLKR